MQTKKVILFCAAITIMVLCKNSPIYAQGSLVRDSIYGSSLENNLLGDPVTRYMQIYLPSGYDTTERNYPVVYLFHTGGGSERFYPYNEFSALLESFGIFTPPQDFPDCGFATMIDSLILTGQIEPLIIVMPNINTAYGGSFCVNSSLNGNYEDYVINDIVPYIDANYRTLVNRNSRAIAGHCMGGHGALYLAMKHPDIFGAVAGHSSELCLDALVRACQPYIILENPSGISGPDPSKPFTSFLYLFSAAFSPNLENPPYFVDLPVDDTCAIREDVLLRWADYDPIQMLGNHLSDLQNLRGIYFDVGDKDEVMSYYFMILFVDSLTSLGISNSFELFDGMHFDKLYTRLKSSLSYLSGVLEHTDQGPTDIPEGNVSGTWTVEGSPYLVNGEITIPNDSTLIIEPGVDVIFTGHYKFNVQGRILTMGTQQDTINFTAQDTLVGWHGIRFMNTANTNDSSKIVWCSLQYGKANSGDDYDRCGGAILAVNFSKLLLSNCLLSFNMNSGDIATTGGGAICILSNSGSPVIENNVISHNRAVGTQGGGICIAYGSSPVIKNNVIFKNRATGGGAVYIYQSNPVFINNTIVENHADLPGSQVCHGGAICIGDCSPQFFNTILFGNTATAGNQINNQGSSQPNFHFCDIEGGKESFSRNMVNGGSYTGIYEFNIDSDPLFLDIASDDYRLSDNSPCISHGADSVEVNGTWYFAPSMDTEGNPRPSPAATTPDIGALESPLGQKIPLRIKELNFVPDKTILYQNYPNPFCTSTTIIFSLPDRQMISLKMFDFQGREVAVLVNEVKQQGKFTVTFNAKELSNGMYFYQLIAGDIIQTRKCMVVR